MKDVIVIGAGIIGATVAKAMGEDRDVMIIDDQREMSGTKPSGGHLKPSWFSGMKKADYEPAMELLDNVWGLIEEEFKVWPGLLNTTVYRVDTDEVIKTKHTHGTVQSIDNLDNYPIVNFTGKNASTHSVRCRLLVVAAGVWCNELLPVSIKPKQGVSFRFKGQLDQPFIKPWAPYKQVVAHQQDVSEIWVGDGTAILQKNWTTGRSVACRKRCAKSLSTTEDPLRAITGLRPYCESGSDPCLLKQMHKRVWLATGAGKSGTIGAGWAARRIINATS